MSELSSDVNLVSIKARQDNVEPETKHMGRDTFSGCVILFVGKLQSWTLYQFPSFGENDSITLRV